MTNLTKFLLVSNIAAIFAAVFLYFNRGTNYHSDNTAIISSVIDSQKKSMDELKDKLSELDDKHDKLMKDYQRALSEVDKRYEEKLSSLEKDRVGSVKNITIKFKGNIVGLAEEFSKETGIKVTLK